MVTLKIVADIEDESKALDALFGDVALANFTDMLSNESIPQYERRSAVRFFWAALGYGTCSPPGSTLKLMDFKPSSANN